jgi:hypothetical protein
MKRKKEKRQSKVSKSGSPLRASGVVKARKCKHCGHHEIGIVTADGKYLALKPGMKVGVFSE